MTDSSMLEFLEGASILSTGDFFKKFPGEPASTIYSRIQSLIKNGIIHRVGHGKYALGKTKGFCILIDDFERQLYSTIKEEFPYSDVVIWNLSTINNLLQHLVNFSLTMVDIERDSVESLYWFLRGKGYNVVTRKRMVDEISDYDGYVFIRPLVTSSPTECIDSMNTASIEKILVDLACDKEFESFQGSEIRHIYENAFNGLTINIDRLLRYAGRKEKRAYIGKILEQIKRQ